MIKASCENAEKGCKEVISYLDLKRHMSNCEYATVKCTNFGCEKELYQKDFAAHETTCEFITKRCDKCDVIIPKEKGDECNDCIKNMAAKNEHLEAKLIAISKKLELSIEQTER